MFSECRLTFDDAFALVEWCSRLSSLQDLCFKDTEIQTSTDDDLAHFEAEIRKLGTKAKVDDCWYRFADGTTRNFDPESE